MEIYSTILWHLRKEVGLSHLAQQLVDADKMCPQAWCALGNCFSLQKEHQTAIKFFQRVRDHSPPPPPSRPPHNALRTYVRLGVSRT
jgi:anaphase-promoting complex subunit 3